jgi:tetratricopeptide (TPR) repeat protein
VSILIAAIGLGTAVPVARAQGPGQQHFQAGLTRARQGDLAGAIESFTAAIADAPRFTDAYAYRSLIRLRQGDVPGARPDLQQAHALWAEARDKVGVAEVLLVVGVSLALEDFATLLTATNRGDQAIEARARAKTYRERLGRTETSVYFGFDPADMLGRYAALLRELNREAEARQVSALADAYARSQRQHFARLQAQATPPVDVPVWRPRFEWTFRWRSPRGEGTFVRVVDREETVDGVLYYVVVRGRTETYLRKADLAFFMEKVAGAIVMRAIPADSRFMWPLAKGRRWTYAFAQDRPQEGVSQHSVAACAVETDDPLTVPAGTFRTLLVVCRNERTGEVVFEYWYAPRAKFWVRERVRLPDGMGEAELTGFKVLE